MAHICSLFSTNRSARTPYSPWTNNSPWFSSRSRNVILILISVSFYKTLVLTGHSKLKCMLMLITQLLFLYSNSLRIKLFSIHIPFIFSSLNLLRASSKTCFGIYCTSLAPRTHFCKQYLNPFFHSLLDKHVSSWLLSDERAVLLIYSTIYRHITYTLNSQNSTFETTHLKRLPLNSVLNPAKFKPVKFSQKLETLRFGTHKFTQDFQMPLMN